MNHSLFQRRNKMLNEMKSRNAGKMFRQFFLPLLLLVLFTSSLLAQEHYTEGHVRVVSLYRTSPGQLDNYMKYLRANFLPQQEEAKKQGLVLDYSILLNVPQSPDDWDIAFVAIYKSFGDALDYNQSDEDKMQKIREKQFKTSDEEKMREMTSKRFGMRTYLGTKYLREISLKPLK